MFMGIMTRITAPFLDLLSVEPKRKQSSDIAKPSVGKVQTRKKAPQVARSSYRATSIDFDESCCGAMKAIGDKRFLVTEGKTPLLPLADCDAAQCSCRYVHHDDRREEGASDRRLIGSLKTDLYAETGEENRRIKSRGRRKADP
jgi:hypothetical protein